MNFAFRCLKRDETDNMIFIVREDDTITGRPYRVFFDSVVSFVMPFYTGFWSTNIIMSFCFILFLDYFPQFHKANIAIPDIVM